MKTNNTKMKGKKVLSMLLALIMVLSVGSPAFSMLGITAGAATSDAYATVFTASDFQDNNSGNLVEDNFSKMIKAAMADGCAEPDGFILGGDYESSNYYQHSTPDAYNRVEGIITGEFPYYNTKNIIGIQGNHDYNDNSVLDDTGLYEFEHYLVYVIANEDYPAGNAADPSPARAKAEETAAKLDETFNNLIARGETRPIFIATHIPLHHNSRSNYKESLYGKILFDKINGYAAFFDVIFLFGHNHSGSFDDYIGGSINYLGKGETIRIPDYNATPSATSYTNQTLNFTYMNYGFVGYANNTNEKTLTMSAFEICPKKIVVTRYSTEGVYKTSREITRKYKTDEPSVILAGYTSGEAGSATGAVALASGFTDPVYSWSSSGPATVTSNGKLAQVAYHNSGEVTLTVTVTENNNSAKKAIGTHSMQITSQNAETIRHSSIRLATTVVAQSVYWDTMKTLEYYSKPKGSQVNFIGSYAGFSTTPGVTWESSNTNVATVKNGVVTFYEPGSTFISLTVSDGTNTEKSTVKLVYSPEKKTEYKYVLVTDLSSFATNDGSSYVLASGNTGSINIMSGITEYSSARGTNIMAKAGTVTTQSMNGIQGFYWDDESCVWNKVSTGTTGVYVLQNEVTGLYLRTRNTSSEGGQTLTTTTNIADGGALFSYNSSSAKVLSSTGYGPRWTSNGWFEANTSANPMYFYKKTPVDPSATIEFRGKGVTGTEQILYSVTDGLQVPAYGDYTNIQKLGNVEWKSSNANVATIDGNGLITFKGVAGKTTITYKVTDASNGTTCEASFTIEAKLGAEGKRTFVYTKTIQPGKNYLIVNSKKDGVGNAISSFKVSNTRLLADRVTVDMNSAGEYVVEIPQTLNSVVWTSEDAGDGLYYLKNTEDNTYLYANSTGAYDDYSGLVGDVYTGASYETDSEQYKWTYDGNSLFNQYEYTDSKTSKTAKTYVRVRSAEFPAPGSDSDEIYFYEEVNASPNGVITLRYNTVGSTLENSGICPGQTETFVPKAENFPDNSKVTFEWSSNNPDVATIDPTTGVITYTGKAGVVTVTLKSTSKAYDANNTLPVDTTTVEITVNGGQSEVSFGSKYYLTDSFVPGNRYILYTDTNISSTNTAVNKVISGGNSTSSSNGQLRLIAEDVALKTDTAINKTYIENSDMNIVWECEKGEDGYYRLKNMGTGKYLALGEYDYNGTQTRAVTTADLDAYDSTMYLIERTSSGYIRSNFQATNEQAVNKNDKIRLNSYFVASSTGSVMQLYQAQTVSDVEVKTQIRKQDYFGSVDITNLMQYRYNIENGDTEQMYRYVEGLQDGYTYTWSTSDTSIATIGAQTGLITYKGKDGYVDIILNIVGKDLNGKDINETIKTTIDVSTEPYSEPTEDYPSYPTEGAVRTNKVAHNVIGTDNFQYTGVSKVELAVTGVPLEQPVDVVVVLDHSDSMNGNNQLRTAIDNTRNFALQLFNANENNRIAIVTFDQYRYNYPTIDATAMVDSSNGKEDRIITGDGSIQNAFEKAENADGSSNLDVFVEKLESTIVNDVGGTNYDSGLNYAYKILEYAKANGGNEKQIVIFMSDGAPTKFNGLQISGTISDSSIDKAWLTGDETAATLAPYLADTTKYPAAANFNPNGDNWFAVAIKTPEGQDVPGMPNTSFYNGYHTGIGAEIYTIGYNTKDSYNLLKTIASDPTNYYSASSDLSDAYSSILENILYAANNAVVEDKLGREFGLQLAQSYNVTGTGEITLDDTPVIQIGAWSLNNAGERVSYKVYETISFTDGAIESASSSVLGDVYNATTKNIVGQYVTYDTVTETFTWNIGNITREEVTLTYYVALDGFKEGTSNAGVYATNNYATLNYTNFRGNECTQTFEVPYLGYKQAVINYEYYLVNDAGQPVDRNNQVVPFAERIIVGEKYKTVVNIPQANGTTVTENDLTVLANGNKKPAGYELFNENAAFSITVTSNGKVTSAAITGVKSPQTTYYLDGNKALLQPEPVEKDNEGNIISYSFNNNISFAVKYEAGIINDTMIYDFGLPMELDVLTNDICAPGATVTGITSTEIPEAELQHKDFTNRKTTTNRLDTANGTVVLDSGKITYTPKLSANMATPTVFYYEVLSGDGKYYYASVTLAPASNVYYEETATVNTVTDDTLKWTEVSGTDATKQNMSSVNDIYGYDSAYDNTNDFSNNSYYKVNVTTGAKKSDTKVYEFVGSGFDLISACGKNTGVQIVKIKKLNGTTYETIKLLIVDTYFTDTTIMDDGLLHQVPIVNFRGDYGTYQVETTATYLNSAGAVKATAKTALASNTIDNGVAVNTTVGTPSKALINELEVLGFENLGNDVEVLWMDDNSILNGGTGVTVIPKNGILSGFANIYFNDGTTTTSLANYIDGFRVYRNGGKDNYIESEQNPTYYNIVTDLEKGETEDDERNFAYIESGLGIDFGNIDLNLDFDAYNKQGGPKGEIYLEQGDAIAFKFSAEAVDEDADVMLGMRAVKGAPIAHVKTNPAKGAVVKNIISATEMYYDVSGAVAVSRDSDYVTVVVANTGEDGSILALNNLKLVNHSLAKSGEVINQNSAGIIGGSNASPVAPTPAVPTPVVPDAVQGEDGNVEDIPEIDVDTDTNVPENDTETDVEDETEINVSTMFPGMPASIASFLEMLFKFLSQLVSSLGF